MMYGRCAGDSISAAAVERALDGDDERAAVRALADCMDGLEGRFDAVKPPTDANPVWLATATMFRDSRRQTLVATPSLFAVRLPHWRRRCKDKPRPKPM